jgi:hypothetical protein
VTRLTFASVAALALAAAACGGVESAPNLAQVVERTEAAGPFAFETTTSRPIDGGGRRESVCVGAVDIPRRESRISCNPSRVDGFETITVGGRIYASGGGTADRWLSRPADDDEVLDEFTPHRLLAAFRRATRTTERVGQENVRREQAVRYALTIECERVELPVCDGETGVVDVWIDEDELVRRIAFGDERLSSVTEFFDFGVPTGVEPPTAELVDESPGGSPCESGPGSPIPVADASAALRRAGFDVERADGFCGEGFAGTLSNESIDQDLYELADDAGFVTCQLTTAPDHIANSAFPRPPRRDLPQPVNRTLENLQCVIYTTGPGAQARIEALDAAFADLKREHGS